MYLKYLVPYFDLFTLLFNEEVKLKNYEFTVQYTIIFYLAILIFFQGKGHLRILNKIRGTILYPSNENIKFQNVCKNYDKI